MCEDCNLTACDPRCPMMEQERKVVAKCRKCGEPIYEGEDALDLSAICNYVTEYYVCRDCATAAINELWED